MTEWYLIESCVDDDCEPSPECVEWYEQHVRCAKCLFPKPEWEGLGESLAVELITPPAGAISMAGLLVPLYHLDLIKLLRVGLSENGVRFGECRLKSSATVRRRIQYATVYVPCDLSAEFWRSKYSRHHQCSGCGRITPSVAWATPAMLRSDVDGREVYVNHAAELVVSKRLALLAQKKFGKTLSFVRVPVLARPEDGDVLPGDEAWNGRFKERRVPKPPTRPVRRELL
jgi:hypothetical protein